MTSPNQNPDPWHVAGRKLGAAWIELRIPSTVHWSEPLRGECRIQALGAPVELSMVSFAVSVEVNDMDGTSFMNIPVQPGQKRVELAANTETVVGFTAPMVPRAGSNVNARVTVSARGTGWWPRGTSIKLGFTLLPPEPLNELAKHVAACSGLSCVQWGVPTELGIKGDFVAEFRPEGRHPLLEDIRLEVFDPVNELRGNLDIGERFQGPGSFILGPDRKRHAFTFQMEEIERAKRFLEELLLPYGSEFRNLPIPGREPMSFGRQKLPLPASKSSDDTTKLPTPAGESLAD